MMTKQGGPIMPDQKATLLSRTPASVWLLLLVLIAWLFYAGIASGGFNIPIERLPWSILEIGRAHV